jgi:sugar phosphate isomerase/epimerase
MKHLFSQSNFYIHKNTIEVIEWALENKFDGIELWAETPHLYVDSATENILERLNKESNKLEYSVHAPFYNVSIASINPGIHKESMRQIKKIISWADHFPLSRINMHMGKTVSNIEFVKDRVREIIYESIEEISIYAREKKVELLIENIGIDKYDFDKNVDELKKVIEKFKLGICLDTSHANITLGAEFFVKEFKDHIRQIHASDNLGSSDDHLPIGEGTINWDIYKDILCNNNIPVVHEIQAPDTPELSTLRSRKNLNKICGYVSHET